MFTNYKVYKLFPFDIEKLYDYLITCSKMFYRLTIKDCRLSANGLVVKNHLCLPKNRNITKWLLWAGWKVFATDFLFYLNENQRDVQSFELLPPTSSMYQLSLINLNLRNPEFSSWHSIFNFEETVTVEVQKYHIAGKGKKQVSKASNAENALL